MKTYHKLFAAALFFFNIELQAQQNYTAYLKDNTTSREHSLDITKMKVEVSFVPEKGLVNGKVTHNFIVLQQKVDSVFFDAPAITIKSVLHNNQSAKFSSTKTGVWVKPNTPLKWDETGTIVFEYEASPRRGIYFIGWNEKENAVSNPFAVRKQIWTQGQGIDNRQWIPMYDDMNDKFITETVITFDKNYQVLSNGTFLGKKENKDGTLTWNYTMTKPHAGYLLMLAIGKYAVNETKTKSGVPLKNWYYPEFKERMEPTYRYTAQMMDFLEKETGIKYPWESYSQVMVQDFIFGAMENTTATIFGDFFNVDERAFLDRNYIGVNCHEMTHQWFGDFITARDSRDAWMQESFATYYPKQFYKELEGTDEWDWQRRAHQNSAVDAGKKDDYAVRHTAGGTARVYPKGAAVISMLEYVLGAEQWKRALNHYLKMHAYANVEMNDMQQAIKDKLGLNADWFFDEWIARGGEPIYQIHYEDLTYNDGSKATEIAIEQVQKTNETIQYFKMPLAIEVHYTDGTFDSVKEMQSQAFEVVKIPNLGKKKISFVLFDPNSNILKQVIFNKSEQELFAQLKGAANYLDRYDAVVALKKSTIESKRTALLAALKNEKHYGIINEIVNQLINDADAETVKSMQGLMNHSRSIIRENVLNKLAVISQNWKPIFVRSLSDSSYDVVKTSMEKLFVNFQDNETVNAILNATKNTFGMNNIIQIKRNEIMVLSANASNNFNKQQALSEQNKFASSAYEFRTRLNALNSFKIMNVLNEELVANIFNAMLSYNGRLAGPATDLANHFSGQFEYKQAMKNWFAKSNLDTKQKETITNVLPWIQ